MTVTTCGNVWAVDFSRVSTTLLNAGVSLEPPPGGWRNSPASDGGDESGEGRERLFWPPNCEGKSDPANPAFFVLGSGGGWSAAGASACLWIQEWRQGQHALHR